MKEKLSTKIKRFYHEHEDTILAGIGIACTAIGGIGIGYAFGYTNGVKKALKANEIDEKYVDAFFKLLEMAGCEVKHF